ncbi:MAG: hypothetical protein WC626_05385 [Methanoregula sp.]
MALFLNGALNGADPWLGLPMYCWALILWWLIVMPAAWFILKRIKWDPFVKFHGLHYARKNDSSAAIIVDDMGDAEMVAEHIAKCIFSYGEDDYEIEISELPLHLIKIGGIIAALLGVILTFTGQILLGIPFILCGIIGYCINRVVPWIYAKPFWYPTKYLKDIDWQKAILYKIGKVNFDCKIAQLLQDGEWDQYPVVNCGGIPVEIVFDSNHWCERRSRQHKAIVKSTRPWNKDNPNDQIHTYTKYQRYLNEGKIEAPAEIKKDYLVPWVRIDLGLPFDLKNNEWAGKLAQMAKTKENKPSGEINKYTLWLIIGGIGSFFGILIIRTFFKLVFH